MIEIPGSVPPRCKILARVQIVAPSTQQLVDVLSDNGFAASFGVEFLQCNYGLALTPDRGTQGTHAFIGVYGGDHGKLLSATSLREAYELRENSMMAGFQGAKKLNGFLGNNSWVHFDRFRSLVAKLGSNFDIVGCTSAGNFGNVIQPTSLWKPDYSYWLACCPLGWLEVDPDYWLVNSYQSLEDLLLEKDGQEVTSE